jgi:hypothetical protein
VRSRSDSDVCAKCPCVRADERTIRFSDASSIRADCEVIRLLVPPIPYIHNCYQEAESKQEVADEIKRRSSVFSLQYSHCYTRFTAADLRREVATRQLMKHVLLILERPQFARRFDLILTELYVIN